MRVEGEVTEVMLRRRSREVVGVRIFRREDSIAVRMRASMPRYEENWLTILLLDKTLGKHTFEVARLDAYQLSFNAFT